MKKFTGCLIFVTLLSFSAFTQDFGAGARNMEAVLKYQERINNGDAKGALEYISDDMVNFGRKVGKKGVELVLNDVFVTFPDWKAETIEVVTIGDAVILRQKISGTHLGMGKFPANGGMLVDVKPTGKKFEVTHMHWYKSRTERSMNILEIAMIWG